MKPDDDGSYRAGAIIHGAAVSFEMPGSDIEGKHSKMTVNGTAFLIKHLKRDALTFCDEDGAELFDVSYKTSMPQAVQRCLAYLAERDERRPQ